MEGSFRLDLSLHASIAPSEDREKVLTAAENVFGECAYQVDERDDRLVLRSSDVACLRRIRDQLRDRRVREAARRMLVKSREGDRTTLLFNRQAAFIGIVAVVSSAEESPLGPLTLRIECDRTDDLMDWLTVHRPEGPQGRDRHEPRQSS